MNTNRRRMIVAACASMMMLGAGTHAAAQVSDPDATIDAVWKTQRFDFEYRSDTTYYNCSALKYKVRRILTSIGARSDVHILTKLCIADVGIIRFQVTLHSPVPATADNVRALTAYDARDELAARLRGESLFTAEELPRFAAEWKTIAFARDRNMRLASGDCDLVEQLRRQVLPKLSVQVLADVRCSIMARNASGPRLTVSALVAVQDPLGRTP